LNQMFDE